MRESREVVGRLAHGVGIRRATRLSEARFRRLADSGILGIVTSDLRGVVSEANDSFLNMVGHTQADVQAGNIRLQEMTPPEWHDRDLQSRLQLETAGVAEAWEKERCSPRV